MNPINYKLAVGALPTNTDPVDLHDGPCWVGQIYVSAADSGTSSTLPEIFDVKDGNDVIFRIRLTAGDDGSPNFVIPCIPGGGYQFHTKLSVVGDGQVAFRYAIQYYPIG